MDTGGHQREGVVVIRPTREGPNTHAPPSQRNAQLNRGTPIRCPYAMNVSSTFTRYDPRAGKVKPAGFNRTSGHSPEGLNSVACIGNSSGAGILKLSESDGTKLAQGYGQGGPYWNQFRGNSDTNSGVDYSSLRADEVYGSPVFTSSFRARNMQVAKNPTVSSTRSPNKIRVRTNRPASAVPFEKQIPKDLIKSPLSPNSTQNDGTSCRSRSPSSSPVNALAESSSTLQVVEENHAEQLSNYFNQLYKHDQLTDVIVHVGSYTFSAHKTMLCCFSPYLANSILRSPEVKDLHMAESITPTGFKKILDYMYTKQLSIEVENLAEILQAANVLHMPHLNTQCLQILEHAQTPALLDILETSHKQGVQKVIEGHVLHRICEHFSNISKFTEFLELCVTCLCCILRRDDIVAENELEVAKAAFAWVKYNEAERMDLVQNVMSCIRLSNMTSTELVRLGQETNFIMRNELVREEILKAHWYKNSTEHQFQSGIDIKQCKSRNYTKQTDTIPEDANIIINPDDPVQLEKAHICKQTHASAQEHTANQGQEKAVNVAANQKHAHHRTSVSGQDCVTNPKPSSHNNNNSIEYLGYKNIDEVFKGDPSLNFSKSYEMYSQPEGVNSDPGIGLSAYDSQTQLESNSEEIDFKIKAAKPKRRVVIETDSFIESRQPSLEPNRFNPFRNIGIRKENLVVYFGTRAKNEPQPRIRALDLSKDASTSFNVPIPENVIGYEIIHVQPYVYVIGGSIVQNTTPSCLVPKSDVLRIHTTSRAWECIPNMNACRYLPCVASVDEKLYVIGGVGESMDCLASMEVCDLRANRNEPVCDINQWKIVLETQNSNVLQWRKLASMPYSRFGASACAIATTIFVAGGSSRIHNMTDDALRTSVLSYETTTDTWCMVTRLSQPRFRPSMTSYCGALYICCGLSSVDNYIYNKTVELWTQFLREWREVAHINSCRIGAYCFTNGSKMWIAGGNGNVFTKEMSDNSRYNYMGDSVTCNDVEIVGVL